MQLVRPAGRGSQPATGGPIKDSTRTTNDTRFEAYLARRRALVYRRLGPRLAMVKSGTEDVCFTFCLVSLRGQTLGPGGVLVPSGSLAGTNEQ